MLFTSILSWGGVLLIHLALIKETNLFFILKILGALVFSIGPILMYIYYLRYETIPFIKKCGLFLVWLCLNSIPVCIAFVNVYIFTGLLMNPRFMDGMW